jgi:hypothetical protein
MTGRNVLVAGDPRSGKSWVAGLLCEQLMLARYCVCIIDPEGDYRTLEALPGVRMLGGLSTPPSPAEVVHALRYPDVSALVDLSAVSHADKVDYLGAVLPALRAWRQRTGLPHGIVVDEAHYFLHGPRVEEMVDLDMGGYTLVTYRASSLEASVRQAAEAIVVTRTTDEREATALAQMGGAGDAGDWQRRLATLTIGEAALLPTVEEAGGRLRRFRLAARLTNHIRHRQKYLDVPVPAHLAFYFSGIGICQPGGTRGHSRSSWTSSCRRRVRRSIATYAGTISRAGSATSMGIVPWLRRSICLRTPTRRGGATTFTMPWPRPFAIGMKGSRRGMRHNRAQFGDWKKPWEPKLPVVLSDLWDLRCRVHTSA